MSAPTPKTPPTPRAHTSHGLHNPVLARATSLTNAALFNGIASTNSNVVVIEYPLSADGTLHNPATRPFGTTRYKSTPSSLSTVEADTFRIIKNSTMQREPEPAHPHDAGLVGLRPSASRPSLPELTQAGKRDAAEEELDDRIQSLPQELQDICYHWAVVAPMEEMKRNGVVVSSSYTPPLALRISSTTRAKAADTYYSNTTFETPNEPSFKTLFMRWFRSLSVANRGKVKSITFRQADEEHFEGFLKDWGEVPGTWSGYFSTSYACGVDVGRMSKELFKLGYDGAVRCWFGDYEEGVEGCTWTEKWCKNRKCIDAVALEDNCP